MTQTTTTDPGIVSTTPPPQRRLTRKRRVALAEQSAKEQRIVQLRSAGANWTQIAEALGYADRASAYNAYKRILDRREPLLVEEHRHLVLDQIDAITAANWSKAMAGDPRAALVILNAIDRRTRLLGLNQETVIRQMQVRQEYDGGTGAAATTMTITEIIKLADQAGPPRLTELADGQTLSSIVELAETGDGAWA